MVGSSLPEIALRSSECGDKHANADDELGDSCSRLHDERVTKLLLPKGACQTAPRVVYIILPCSYLGWKQASCRMTGH